MQRFLLAACALALGIGGAIAPAAAGAKETVKIVFIGPLTGGNAALGLGGRNSADLAVQLHNADPKAKYTFDMVKLDDQCKPDIGVQVATKAGADNSIIAGVTHYCSAVAIATDHKANVSTPQARNRIAVTRKRSTTTTRARNDSTRRKVAS